MSRTRKSVRKNWKNKSTKNLSEKPKDKNINRENNEVTGKPVQQNVQPAEISDTAESLINNNETKDDWKDEPRKGYFSGRPGPGRPKGISEPEGPDNADDDVSLSELKQELRKLVLRLARKAKPESFSAASQLLSQIERLMVSESKDKDQTGPVTILSSVPRPIENTTEALRELSLTSEPAADIAIPSDEKEPVQGNAGQPVKCRCGAQVPGNLNTCPSCSLNLISAGIRKIPAQPLIPPGETRTAASKGGFGVVTASGIGNTWQPVSGGSVIGGVVGGGNGYKSAFDPRQVVK